jgi:hypothetical protein
LAVQNISRKQAIVTMLGDGAVHVSAGGINPITIVRFDMKNVISLKRGAGSQPLNCGDVLELDGFKRGDRAKFPDGAVHVFRVVDTNESRTPNEVV